MAKANGKSGMHGKADRKTRGRGAIAESQFASPTRPDVPVRLRAEANRPVNAGGTKHRGDRRDTNKLYTNNAKHKARGNNARPDVSTRKR